MIFFLKRIFDLLNDPRLHPYSIVDAKYYDYSVLPENVRDQFYRDMYLLYGITEQGEFITKWVERYDLDCNDPIVNGKVIREMDK